ncbi:flavin-containing monooxygenase [Agrobacterium tumefaciens]|uniref:NAD(P)/FAD-dependent oxidoreductase n=1 Tax=Agrobacterium tumefaciens TaxID=358 RepID=A0AA44FBS3_AGRTU|nr:NAD(P)/FAD-dependent oxidoreductase [Agrobacterium tumefaciens]NTB87722.1 NAD(P)/FAD-dependent oxidoreductase [Agrobacterium tumefaciens]NTC32055.1 NAD(P)/FAD-dependent oxidoreductase [Agrobacterium tumefaciens]
MEDSSERSDRTYRQSVAARSKIERQKRLRDDGLGQYVRLDERLPHLAADPFKPIEARQPKLDHVTFAFLGGGFSGLVTCARLREVGIDSLRIIDRAGDFGGTWYWNRYPGAQCDTASMVYLPLLEETGYFPTEKYAHGPEILAHCHRIGRHYDLYRDALFHTNVTSLVWSDRNRTWRVKTDRGDDFTAQYIGLGIGELHIPKLPGVKGFDKFKGRSVHTSRWDYGYTSGPLGKAGFDGLADQRVGVVGTGATAVQCVPEIADYCRDLFVFQRTPSAVFPRGNHALERTAFAQILNKGWQQRWLTNFAANRGNACPDVDLVDDGWTSISRRICERARKLGLHDIAHAIPEAENEINFQYMEAARNRIDELVTEQKTAEALKPWYDLFCKRPCFHDSYLLAFNRPNVHLIDTDGKGIDEVVEKGIVAGGRLIELDCIVYASGFEAWTPYVERLGFDPKGTRGVTLSAHWRNGRRTMHGIHVAGFPNMFLVEPTQGASLFSNITHNICSSADAIAAVVKFARETNARCVEVAADAENQWVNLILSSNRVLGSPECTPGRYNYEGQDVGEASRLDAGYPMGALPFFDYLKDWCQAGFRGLLFR